MSQLNWDEDAMRRWADGQARWLARASLPVVARVVDGRFPVKVDGLSIVAPPEAAVEEYGDGKRPNQPWVMESAYAVKEAFGGSNR